MLEHRAAEWGQYGFYTASGIPHRVWHLMPVLCEKKKKNIKTHTHTTARSHRGENNIITMLARGKKESWTTRFFFFPFQRQNRMIAGFQHKPRVWIKRQLIPQLGSLCTCWHLTFCLFCFVSFCFKVDQNASKSVRFSFSFFLSFFFSSFFLVEGGAPRECCRLVLGSYGETGETRSVSMHEQKHTHTHTHTHWERACYLPCSSGNSPTSSDNLDQSVGSMNPHLPGAQDKISRPSQVVRDWRHEITFGVFLTHYCLSKHNAGAGHTHTQARSRAHESTHAHGAEESGGVCVCVCVCVRERERVCVSVLGTLPSHPFAAELRHQLWWWCAVSPPPGCEKKSARSLREHNYVETHTHVLAKKQKTKKTIPLSK